LLDAAMAGRPSDVERLIREIADTVWTACQLVSAGQGDTEALFDETIRTLSADGFARLKPYDGRSPLSTFVALATRDILAQRAIRLLALDRSGGWPALERFLAADIRRSVRRRMPRDDPELEFDDAYQAVLLGLVEDDFRRVRAFNGQGSFTGYILHVVDHLVVDHLRRSRPRRRLPARIARLDLLAQEVFRRVHWDGERPEDPGFAQALARIAERPVPPNEIDALLNTVAVAGSESDGAPQSATFRAVPLDDVAEFELLSAGPGGALSSPEQDLIDRQEEECVEAATSALNQALTLLPDPERLYLKYHLAGHPAREIAALMHRPVAEVYALAQAVKAHLRQTLTNHPAVKQWRMSV
jgi:RNA polymerase primary sigma factor